MATAGKLVSSSSSSPKPFDFSDDSVPKRVVLSSDQQRYCLEVLKVFKDKRFSAPEKIRQEFMTLQVRLHYTLFLSQFYCYLMLCFFIKEEGIYSIGQFF